MILGTKWIGTISNTALGLVARRIFIYFVCDYYYYCYYYYYYLRAAAAAAELSCSGMSGSRKSRGISC